MQALKSLFAARQAQVATPSRQLVELSAEALKQVAGGLPRVGRIMPVEPVAATVDELPRVG